MKKEYIQITEKLKFNPLGISIMLLLTKPKNG